MRRSLSTGLVPASKTASRVGGLDVLAASAVWLPDEIAALDAHLTAALEQLDHFGRDQAAGSAIDRGTVRRHWSCPFKSNLDCPAKSTYIEVPQPGGVTMKLALITLGLLATTGVVYAACVFC